MAKKKTPKPEVVVADGTNTGEEFTRNQKLNWEDIALARSEACKSLIAQQSLTLELTKTYSDIIESDIELKETILGISNSYDDIVDEIVGIDEAYKMRTGEVANGDEELEYLQIAERYIAMQEKVANISSSGFMDVFVTLKIKGVAGIDTTDLNAIAEAVVDGKKDIINTIKEAEASTEKES
jgi:hypothetical protein